MGARGADNWGGVRVVLNASGTQLIRSPPRLAPLIDYALQQYRRFIAVKPHDTVLRSSFMVKVAFVIEVRTSSVGYVASILRFLCTL